MSTLRIVAATALAAVAVLAVLLARDLRGWQRALAQGDAVYTVAPGKATWTPSPLLGGTAETLLGTGNDVAFRRGLQLYAVAAATPNRLDTAEQLQTLRAQAASALAAAAHGPHASQAETLLGVLAFEQAAGGTGSNGADAAIAAFENAVRADPTNTAAKFDLELMLRLTAAHGTRAGAGAGGSFGRGGRRGAGGGVAGSGY
ncbi:MAG: hypothetical protein QOF75_2887 [Gaiellaceae bacterium]|nr:hypothetical protein [Gaiellaceae bacterium]